MAEKTPLQRRIEKLFNRREGTAWGPAERKAWKASRAVVEATTEEELALLGWFHGRPATEATYKRKDLATLLNNWGAEIDRARQYKAGRGEYQDAF